MTLLISLIMKFVNWMVFLYCVDSRMSFLTTTECGGLHASFEESCMTDSDQYYHFSFYSRIAEQMEQSLPKLETIILTNNNIEDLVHTA